MALDHINLHALAEDMMASLGGDFETEGTPSFMEEVNNDS